MSQSAGKQQAIEGHKHAVVAVQADVDGRFEEALHHYRLASTKLRNAIAQGVGSRDLFAQKAAEYDDRVLQLERTVQAQRAASRGFSASESQS